MLEPANHRVLAFVREYEDERLLVVANLSRFSQAVELDLGAWAGSTPVELFGRTTFWPIDGDPYKLSLGPHAFYWFALRPAPDARLVEESDIDSGRAPVPVIEVDGSWRDLIDGSDRSALEEVLPAYLGRQPWFRGSADAVLHVTLLDALPLRDGGDQEIFLVPTTVISSDRDATTYLLALHLVAGDAANEELAREAIARIRSGEDGEALLVDAIESGVVNEVLGWITSVDRQPLTGIHGTVTVLGMEGTEVVDFAGFGSVVASHSGTPSSQGEGGRMLVKFLRRINEGINPEWELGESLTGAAFSHTPTVLGALEYKRPNHGPMTIAVLQRFVPHDGTAWELAIAALDEIVGEALD